MRKIDITEIKEKTVGFVKEHKSTIAYAGMIIGCNLVCFKLGELNERSKPDLEKSFYKAFTNDCMKGLPYYGPFKIHGFANTTLGKFNGLDMAKAALNDPETVDSIIGLAMFVKRENDLKDEN